VVKCLLLGLCFVCRDYGGGEGPVPPFWATSGSPPCEESKALAGLLRLMTKRIVVNDRSQTNTDRHGLERIRSKVFDLAGTFSKKPIAVSIATLAWDAQKSECHVDRPKGSRPFAPRQVSRATTPVHWADAAAPLCRYGS
jgi:hypothetical protein